MLELTRGGRTLVQTEIEFLTPCRSRPQKNLNLLVISRHSQVAGTTKKFTKNRDARAVRAVVLLTRPIAFSDVAVTVVVW